MTRLSSGIEIHHLLSMILFCDMILFGMTQQATIQAYNNSAMVGSSMKEISFHNLTTSNSLITIPGMVSARLLGTLDVSLFTKDSVVVDCDSKMPMLLWLDDHLVCQNGFYNVTDADYNSMDGRKETPILIYPWRTNWTLYGEFWPSDEEFSLTIHLTLVKKEKESLAGHISPGMPSVEMKRLEIIQQLQEDNWFLYSHDTLQEAIWLPGGIRLRWTLCKEDKCLDRITPAMITPHLTTKDLVYFDLSVFDGTLSVRVYCNFEKDLEILFETLSCGDGENDCSPYTIRVNASIAYAPARSGTVSQPNDKSLQAYATGLRSFTFSVLGDQRLILPNIQKNEIQMRVPPPKEMIAVSTKVIDETRESASRLLKLTQDKVALRVRQYQRKSKNVDLAMAIDAAIYFNLIYTPAERTLIAPVSREPSWVQALCMPTDRLELGYVLFDWDNALVAFMMAKTGKREIAYANLIQSIRSRTANGFKPNLSGGGHKSQDRSEPPLDAKVLEEIYNTYQELWLVELLWSDLAIQVDWFWSNRRLDGFIVLGSDPVAYPNNHKAHSMQGARFESGLDNSPMYDGDFFEDGLMQLYDVGMTSLILQEMDSLVRLSKLIGRDASVFERRSALLRTRMAAMWDPEDNIFSNRFPNGTFSKRRTPTSFYPLLGHVASDAQAQSIVTHWLMNSTRFCIVNRTDDCYWGLPSISADDPAFPMLGYWRGYVWGPMSMIVYWSLDNYKHLRIVAHAKKHLASQMTDMFMNMWHKKGRVCENYSPHRNATECTGDLFYHWGALNGLLSLLEYGTLDNKKENMSIEEQ